MPTVSLPDGSQKEYSSNITIDHVASDIGAGLQKAAVAGEFNGRLVDTSYEIDDHGSLKIVTGKDEVGLEVIRHSTAHLLAQAVKRLFPQAQVTIGPVIEDGFYCDSVFERGLTRST